ncbi:class I SAM-dependent RNA methyltransferase [Roseobacter sp. HKCCA0434]|uniref:class I SAM-dependent RNA methyltransferase n=1 Tax=Roseobacter sp. HKCCA0434 TaxID=3079297 RepID=UPI002905839A|nr:TRAM domain-containing protein [Roseobacter sp. HKCCA0434]
MSTVTIDRLGHQGDGIATHEGRDIFIPFTLPGEAVTTTDPAEVLRPSPARVTPVCRHFGTCGGCAVQHASDAFAAEWKVDIVRQALAARGLDAPVKGVATSPAGMRRRATFGGRRTRKGALVGFHQRASDTLIAIEECPVCDPSILAAVPALEALTLIGASRTGVVRLSVTASLAGSDVDVREAQALDAKMLPDLVAIAEAHDLARLTWNGEAIATRRPPEQRMGRALLVPPPGAFLQATPQGQAALIATVKAAVGKGRRIADLFAGCGTFTLPLLDGAEIHAVEAEADMLAAVDTAWRRTTGLHGLTTEVRDLFRRPLLQSELERFDAVVLDPPRAGAAHQAEELAASKVARIAFVSCNPVTFARDAQMLVNGGYGLRELRVIDQFRWSPHIEISALFTR